MSETLQKYLGNVRISNEVIATIAGMAAAEVAGVAGMSGGLAGGIVEILRGKNLSKGVKIETKDRNITIDLFMIVEYGAIIHDVGRKSQIKVKEAVEAMTGLNANEINIHIQGVNMEKEIKKAQ